MSSQDKKESKVCENEKGHKHCTHWATLKISNVTNQFVGTSNSSRWNSSNKKVKRSKHRKFVSLKNSTSYCQREHCALLARFTQPDILSITSFNPLHEIRKQLTHFAYQFQLKSQCNNDSTIMMLSEKYFGIQMCGIRLELRACHGM